MAMHRYTISTWADSRSNRRDRTVVLTAEHAKDALYQARLIALAHVNQHVSIAVEIIDVDGMGAPVDCDHAKARLHDGWTIRADGGRDCRGCANAKAQH